MKRTVALVLACAALPAIARAQQDQPAAPAPGTPTYTMPPPPPLTLDPSGQTPVYPGAPPNPYAPPGSGQVLGTQQPAYTPTSVAPLPGTVPTSQPAENEMYLGAVPGAKSAQRFEGELPEVHVVQKGDTLWDICSYYFGNPWKWPEIWGLNPQITNPHWIYPGNVVRLGGAGRGPATAAASAPSQTTEPGELAREQPAEGPQEVTLRENAFVSMEDLKVAAIVKGATVEQKLLATNDEIFLEYPEGRPPQVNARYSIYTPQKDVIDPSTHAVIGKFVLIRGNVKVLEVKKGKPARGIITDVTNADGVERGDRVGLLKTQFHALTEVPAATGVEALIAGIIGSDQLIGSGQVVFIDRGRADGMKVGNRMQVVRRGDAYPKYGALTQAVDDRAYPDVELATVVVLDVGERTALGWVMQSEMDLHIGDHLVMRRSK